MALTFRERILIVNLIQGSLPFYTQISQLLAQQAVIIDNRCFLIINMLSIAIF